MKPWPASSDPGTRGRAPPADHIEVLTEALASIPEGFRPRPGDPDSPAVLIRSDSAGATYGFAEFCRDSKGSGSPSGSP